MCSKYGYWMLELGCFSLQTWFLSHCWSHSKSSSFSRQGTSAGMHRFTKSKLTCQRKFNHQIWMKNSVKFSTSFLIRLAHSHAMLWISERWVVGSIHTAVQIELILKCSRTCKCVRGLLFQMLILTWHRSRKICSQIRRIFQRLKQWCLIWHLITLYWLAHEVLSLRRRMSWH